MPHDDPPRECEPFPSDRPETGVSTGAHHREGSESLPAAIVPLTIATTDPIIETVADFLFEWKRHPDTTIVVATNQVGEPRQLSLSSFGTMPFDRPSRVADPAVAAAYRPPMRHRGASPGAVRPPNRGDRESGNRTPRQDRPAPRPGPSPMKNLLVLAGVALICAALGTAAFRYFARPGPAKFSSPS